MRVVKCVGDICIWVASSDFIAGDIGGSVQLLESTTARFGGMQMVRSLGNGDFNLLMFHGQEARKKRVLTGMNMARGSNRVVMRLVVVALYINVLVFSAIQHWEKAKNP